MRQEWQDWQGYARMVCELKSSVELFPNPALGDLTHAVLGLTSEIGELLLNTDLQNLAEELGDLLWYAQLGLSATVGTDGMTSLDSQSELGATLAGDIGSGGIRGLIVAVSALADLNKRLVFYGTGYTEDLHRKQHTNLCNVIKCIASIGANGDITLVDIRNANVAKLTRRYPDGKFVKAHSDGRDVQAESQAMASQLGN